MSCIEDTRSRDKEGYVRPGNRSAHRMAWEQTKGPIPAGMVIHHRCRNRACINIEHLELLSKAEHDELHAHDGSRRPGTGRPRGSFKCDHDNRHYFKRGDRVYSYCKTCRKK